MPKEPRPAALAAHGVGDAPVDLGGHRRPARTHDFVVPWQVVDEG